MGLLLRSSSIRYIPSSVTVSLQHATIPPSAFLSLPRFLTLHCFRSNLSTRCRRQDSNRFFSTLVPDNSLWSLGMAAAQRLWCLSNMVIAVVDQETELHAVKTKC